MASPLRGGARAAQHQVELRRRGQALVLAVEAPDELAALAIGEAGQVAIAARVEGIVQRARASELSEP